MDENYLDGLLSEVSSKPKQNKYFDNNVNSDSSVDIDMSDLDDISLDELDNLDDLDLGDFDLNDLDLDELDFDDLDITRLDVKNDKPSVDKSDDDFSLDDLINESEASEEIEETTEALDDYSFEDISEEQEVREEISDNNADADSSGFDLDELLGGATSSEDALFDSVFNEANNQLEEDTSVNFAGLDELTAGGEESTGSDSFDLDDLFSALGIEEESTSESNPYTAGQDDLDALFESTNASAIELGELEDIEEVPEVKGKKKKKTVLTPAQIADIKKVYNAWQSVDTTLYADVPEFCQSVKILKKDKVRPEDVSIEEKDFALTPSKYIEFIDHDLDIDFNKEMSRIQQEMTDLIAQEKQSQKMLEDAFRGIGYGIDKI